MSSRATSLASSGSTAWLSTPQVGSQNVQWIGGETVRFQCSLLFWTWKRKPSNLQNRNISNKTHLRLSWWSREWSQLQRPEQIEQRRLKTRFGLACVDYCVSESDFEFIGRLYVDISYKFRRLCVINVLFSLNGLLFVIFNVPKNWFLNFAYFDIMLRPFGNVRQFGNVATWRNRVKGEKGVGGDALFHFRPTISSNCNVRYLRIFVFFYHHWSKKSSL